jgi:hypothetical protein
VDAPYPKAPDGASRWDQTAWQRAAADTSTLRGAGSDANTRILEELGKSGRTGPIAEDDDPWIRQQNEETRRQLEMLGFPDLVLKVVLDELQLGTWEGVTDDAKGISRRLAEALADPRFHVLDRL